MKFLGMMDSGIGGLLLCQKIHQAHPDYNLCYLADQAHAPYGNLNQSELLTILQKDCAWLEQMGATQILIACNTACSSGILDSYSKGAELLDIIKPTCRQLPDKINKVLVFSTVFTANQHLYRREIQHLYPHCEVVEVGLANLATMIEQTRPLDEIREYLLQQCHPYQHQGQAVILGCTHFPFVKALFEEILKLPVYDSCNLDLPVQPGLEGQLKIVTTANAQILARQMKELLHWDVPCQAIQLD